MLKALLELGVRLVERDRGVNSSFSAQIHDREQQVTELRFEGVMTLVQHGRRTWPRRRRFLQLCPNLSELLFDFLRRSFDIWPVEPYAGSTILEPMRAVQRRK